MAGGSMRKEWVQERGVPRNPDFCVLGVEERGVLKNHDFVLGVEERPFSRGPRPARFWPVGVVQGRERSKKKSLPRACGPRGAEGGAPHKSRAQRSALKSCGEPRMRNPSPHD